MAWIGAAIGAVGGLLGGGDEGGGGGPVQQQTVSKDPWSAADPWLRDNIRSGQALQNQYTANPFNAQQLQGYNNQYKNADYMRSLTGSVLGQMNGFKPFDRGNPNARPQSFQFNNLEQIAGQTPYSQAPMPAPMAAPQQQQMAPAPEPGSGDFGYMRWKYDNEQNQLGRDAADSLGMTLPAMQGLDYETYKQMYAPSSPIARMNKPREGY